MDEDLPEISCLIKDTDDLYQAYMPFIENGGLFIKTAENHQLGDLVLIRLQLLEDPAIYLLKTKVVWLSPDNSQAHTLFGIGVQFLDDDKGQVRSKIETYLAGKLNASHPTLTL